IGAHVASDRAAEMKQFFPSISIRSSAPQKTISEERAREDQMPSKQSVWGVKGIAAPRIPRRVLDLDEIEQEGLRRRYTDAQDDAAKVLVRDSGFEPGDAVPASMLAAMLGPII